MSGKEGAGDKGGAGPDPSLDTPWFRGPCCWVLTFLVLLIWILPPEHHFLFCIEEEKQKGRVVPVEQGGCPCFLRFPGSPARCLLSALHLLVLEMRLCLWSLETKAEQEALGFVQCLWSWGQKPGPLDAASTLG